MIDILLGIPGRLKTLSDFITTNWTAARSAKVDNLDAAITTRAAGSTALSTVDWTAARAAKLDNAIQTSVIQSIQRGYVAGMTSATIVGGYYVYDFTIAAVVIAKCAVTVRALGNNAGAPIQGAVLAESFPATTTLRFSSLSGGLTFDIAWEIVEYK